MLFFVMMKPQLMFYTEPSIAFILFLQWERNLINPHQYVTEPKSPALGGQF